MRDSINNHIRNLADNICIEDFRALSSGIGLETRALKKNIEPTVVKKVEPKTPPRKSLDFSSAKKSQVRPFRKKKTLTENEIMSFSKFMESRGLPFEEAHVKQNKNVKHTFLGWIKRRLLYTSVDCVFILMAMGATISVYHQYKMAHHPSFSLSFYEYFFYILRLFNAEEYLFALSFLLFVYVVLFKVIVGATLGELAMRKKIHQANHEKNNAV